MKMLFRLFSRERGSTYLLFIVLILGPAQRHITAEPELLLCGAGSWDVTNVANCE